MFCSRYDGYNIKSYKAIEDIVEGDLVMTHTSKFQKVLKVGSDYKKTLTIKAQGIKPTETTNNHPYYVRQMGRRWDNALRTYNRTFGEPTWKSAGDLKKGDFLGIPINKESEDILNLSDEECYILGRYIADGHTRKDYRTSEGRPNDRQWQLILSIGEDKVKKFKERINKLHFSCHKHGKGVFRCVFSNKRLVEIAEEFCGIGAINKIFPQAFINLPKDKLKMVLEGYMDGDGSTKDGVFRASSISENLILSLSQVVAKVFNTNSSYYTYERDKKCVIEGRLVNQKRAYTISFRKEMKKQSHAVVIDDIIWLPFKKSEQSDIVQKVYNLEVENDNSYTANNAIVHNCQDFSGANKERLGVEGEKSGLFFEYVRLLKETSPKYFLLENVRMKKEHQNFISEILGCEPIVINSQLVAPHLRHRLYWTNIPNIEQPTDLKLKLNDYLINGYSDREKARTLLESDSRPLSTPIKMCHRHFNKGFTTLIFKSKEHYERLKEHFDYHFKGRSAKEIDELIVGMDLSIYEGVRYMNNREREACQTVPQGYTDSLSQNDAACLLGDGWTVDVIAHIFKNIK